MAGVDENKARRPISRALAQVATAGCAGPLTLLLGFHMVAFTATTGSSQAGLLVMTTLAVVGIGVQYGAASIAPEASWLTRTKGGRVAWAVLVGGLGTVGLSLGWRISDAAGLDLSRHPAIWMPLTTVPFALVAGMLLRRWYLAVGSLALAVAGAAALLAPLAATMPSGEVSIRLAGKNRNEFFATQIPGYHVIPQTGSWQLEPDDPDAQQTPAARHVEITVRNGSSADECAAFARPGALSPYLECVDELPDLYYRRLADRHIYLHEWGTVEILVVGGLGVDRDLLRDAALAARPATDDELLTILYPVPQRNTTFMDSVKIFAKQVFG